jgi:arylsulfatase A-like enzyme
MKFIRFNRSGRALAVVLLAIATLEFLPVAQAQFIFTNTAPTPMPRRANIILIVADGLGCGDLSCYGQTKFQTPNLDRLAAGGVRFTNYYAGGAASSPARAALMLGKNPAHLRQRADMDIPLAQDEITVAQILKNSGYHTGLIGEWDLGDENSGGAPWKKGFDEFAGYFDPADAENYYADYMWRYAPMAILNPTNNQMETYNRRETIYSNISGQKGLYIPDLSTKDAMNFVKYNQPDQFNRHQPFFLLVNYKIPRPNAAEAMRTGNGMQVPTDAPFSEEPWPQPEKNKASMISRLDGYIGQLLEQLRVLSQESNTVIFFTSDTVPKKGGGVDPAFFQSILSTNDLRVPMIVNWPGRIAAGQVSGLKCSAQDFLPTAAAIALIKPPEQIDGASILPAMSGEHTESGDNGQESAPIEK